MIIRIKFECEDKRNFKESEQEFIAKFFINIKCKEEMDERKKIIGRVLVGITMLLTIAQTFSISYFLLFNETKLLSFDSEISANGDTKEVPLRNLDIADISHTYLIFFISITSLALMFLSLISHFLSDYNQNQKKNIVIVLLSFYFIFNLSF